MSIDRDTFENTSEDELEELSVPDQVLGFLAVNEDRAFKTREVASQIGVDEGAVSTALSRLKDRELVEHKATYWAVTDDVERLEGSAGTNEQRLCSTTNWVRRTVSTTASWIKISGAGLDIPGVL